LSQRIGFTGEVGMGWRIACGAILGVTLMRAAMAQVPFAEASVGTSIETWRIPGGESMDMAAARLLFQVADGWRVGPVAYGAVGGQRGGFITLGAEAERAWRLGSTATLDTGFFVGAGGGRGGRELAGGGLMWRAHAGWSMAVSRNDRIGLGVSHVRFPSQGVIRSTQPYFRYERWFESPVRPMGEAGLEGGGWHTPLDHAMGIRVRTLKPSAGVRRTDAVGALAAFQTLGVQWRADDPSSGLSWILAADGALGGESAGYMQILAGPGWRWHLNEQWELAAHVALGAAGGGGVDTGGGLLTEVGATLAYQVTPSVWTSLGWIHQRAAGGRYVANGATIGLNYRWGGLAGSPATRALTPVRHPLRVRWLQQRLRGAATDWRCCDADTSVYLLGMAVDRFWGDEGNAWRPFLTGQGLAAYRGQAGAYMQGMLGGGMQWKAHPHWALEVEGTLGAAGGGGLRTGGGAVAQWEAGLVWQPTPAWSLRAGIGRLRALDGPLKAQTVGVSIGYRVDAWGNRR
jgi:hypothetical protein